MDPHPLLPDIPYTERPRHLILLPIEDYNSIPKQLLNDYLAPLFPLTRPSNIKKIEKIAKPKAVVTPVKSNASALLAQAQQTQLLLDQLKAHQAKITSSPKQ